MIRKYLSTAYISITFSNNVFHVHTRVFKSNAIIKDTTQTFQEKNKLIQYLQEDIKSYYFYYLGVLFDSIGQGGLQNIEPQTLEKFQINKNNITLLKMDTMYIYANNQELNKTKVMLEENEIDVDFIISPFAILHRQIKHLNVFSSKKNVFYILKYENYITLMIVKNKQLLFSTFFYTAQEKPQLDKDTHSDYIKSDVEELVEQKEEEDDENLFKESDTLFEDVTNIENIDNIDSLELDDFEEVEEQENLGTFSLDMNLFESIKAALSEYYSNDIYESEFIEEIVIFSDQKISKSILNLIEDDLFIKPHTYEVDIHEQMQSIMKESL